MVAGESAGNRAMHSSIERSGGTGVGHAINWLLESIDLAVDYVTLGFMRDRDPRR
jgi:hypothetical protein